MIIRRLALLSAGLGLCAAANAQQAQFFPDNAGAGYDATNDESVFIYGGAVRTVYELGGERIGLAYRGGDGTEAVVRVYSFPL